MLVVARALHFHGRVLFIARNGSKLTAAAPPDKAYVMHNDRFSGVQRARRRTRDRVRNQVHGDVREGVHKCGGGLLHFGEGYQGQDGKETGETALSSICKIHTMVHSFRSFLLPLYNKILTLQQVM